MGRLLSIHLLFLWSCGALPVRIESSVKPSREPDLEAVPAQNWEDYVRNQSEALFDLKNSADTRPVDAYEIYQNGGREFIRRLFRSVRDADLDEHQTSLMDEKQLKAWEGGHCVSLSLDQIMRTGLPLQGVMTAIPLFGLELTQLTDPDWMNNFREISSRDTALLLDDLHRVILFESGIRVRGSHLKKAPRKFLEFTYKVVHERGEPSSWLKRDNWGTRVRMDLQQHDYKHQKLVIMTESGRNLYEDSAAKIDFRRELSFSWDDKGLLAKFHIGLSSHDQLQIFSMLRNRQEGSLTLRWQVEQAIRQLKLYDSSTSLCHGRN